MFTITIPATEFFDESRKEFINVTETTLALEHSLVSLSKWECLWEKPFLSDANKTDKETLSYIEAMTLTPNVDPNVYLCLADENITSVRQYIDSKMTATWFADKPAPKGGKEIITAEIIYYWMIALTIPFEAQHWHLNRLLTLIKVCNQKNAPEKKMSRAELVQRNRQLNEQRKAQMQTQG